MEEQQQKDSTKKVLKIDPTHFQVSKTAKNKLKKEKKQKDKKEKNNSSGGNNQNQNHNNTKDANLNAKTLKTSSKIEIQNPKIKSQLLENIHKRKVLKEQQQQQQQNHPSSPKLTKEGEKNIAKGGSNTPKQQQQQSSSSNQTTHQNKFEDALMFLKNHKIGVKNKNKTTKISSSSSSFVKSKGNSSSSSSPKHHPPTKDVQKEKEKTKEKREEKRQDISKEKTKEREKEIPPAPRKRPEVLLAWPEDKEESSTSSKKPYRVDNDIQYGNLKGGIKKTFRNLSLSHNSEKHSSSTKTTTTTFNPSSSYKKENHPNDDEEFYEDLIDNSTKHKLNILNDDADDNANNQSFSSSSSSFVVPTEELKFDNFEDNAREGGGVEEEASQNDDSNFSHLDFGIPENDLTKEEEEMKNEKTTDEEFFEPSNEIILEKPFGNLTKEREKENMNENNQQSLTEELLEKYGPTGGTSLSPLNKTKKDVKYRRHTFTERVKYRLGKNKTKRIVNVLLKNQETVNKIKEACEELKNENLETMKKYLIDRNLLKPFSVAPSDLIKELYETSYLTGDLSNTQQLSLQEFENYFHYKDSSSSSSS